MKTAIPPLRFRNRRAFTLVELLVVIVIIAILAGLLLTAITTVRQKGNQTKCTHNLRQWAVAILGYSQENNGEVVWQNWASIGADGRVYEKYLGGNLQTPSFNAQNQQVYATALHRWCPSVPWTTGNPPACYGFVRPNPKISSIPSFNLRQATRPTKLALMIESDSVSGNLNPGGVDYLDTYVKPICTVKGRIRHGGGFNVLFADGHVDMVPWTSVDRDTPEEQTEVALWFELQAP